jgi:FtsH-binding integral membrane protein
MRKIYNTLLTVIKDLWFKMDMEQIARWAYIAFVAIAIVMGLAVGYMAYSADLHWADLGVADSNGWVTLVMLILGVIIGLTSITEKEVTPFLTVTIALIVASVANVWSPLGNIHELLYYWATAILNYIVAFAAPAAVIIAIRALLPMAKEK